MANLSIGILTYNSEEHLSKVLESVDTLADEVIILDSGSEDRTVEIAKSFGAKVYFRKFDNFVNQKNHLLSLCKGRWVLFLDDDEVLSKQLAESVKEAVSKDDMDGYYVNVLTNYLGRWIKHAWYPDWHLRLAKRDRCVWVGAGVHESLKVEGKLGYLKGDLLHYSYKSLHEHVEKINLYTELFAKTSSQKPSFFKILTSPVGAFLRRFVFKRGFLDGKEGFILSVMASYYSFLKYAKLWERKR